MILTIRMIVYSLLFVYVNFFVLDTRILTMDCPQKLDSLDIDNHDRCDYIDPDLSENILIKNDKDLNIMQLNIRGLISKQSKLCDAIKGSNIDNLVHVFILNETWITKSNEHLIQILNYNYIGKHRTHKKGGGCLMSSTTRQEMTSN